MRAETSLRPELLRPSPEFRSWRFQNRSDYPAVFCVETTPDTARKPCRSRIGKSLRTQQRVEKSRHLVGARGTSCRGDAPRPRRSLAPRCLSARFATAQREYTGEEDASTVLCLALVDSSWWNPTKPTTNPDGPLSLTPDGVTDISPGSPRPGVRSLTWIRPWRGRRRLRPLQGRRSST